MPLPDSSHTRRTAGDASSGIGDRLRIRGDDLSGPEIRALLKEHLRNMAQI